MRDKLEMGRDWFLNQSNTVKAVITIGVGILIILIIILLTGLVFPADSPLTGNALENYKASCIGINFQELNNNINKYKGQHIKFTGQVVQINENNGRTEIVLAVKQVSGGWSSSDLIFITYKAPTDFKKGDIVTVYGDVSGTYNYFSTAGQFILVKITARYIELTPITAPSVVSVPFTNPVTNDSISTNNNSSGSENLNNSSSPTDTPTTTTTSTTTSPGQPI